MEHYKSIGDCATIMRNAVLFGLYFWRSIDLAYLQAPFGHF